MTDSESDSRKQSARTSVFTRTSFIAPLAAVLVLPVCNALAESGGVGGLDPTMDYLIFSDGKTVISLDDDASGDPNDRFEIKTGAVDNVGGTTRFTVNRNETVITTQGLILSSDAVEGSEIKDGSITADDIANNTIGNVDINNADDFQMKSLDTAAGIAAGTTLSVVGATTLSSTLSATGPTTLGSTLTTAGATLLNNTLNVAGASTLGNTMAVTVGVGTSSELAVTDNAVAIAAATSILGATQINSTGDANTSIGNAASANGRVDIFAGNSQFAVANGNASLSSDAGRVSVTTGTDGFITQGGAGLTNTGFETYSEAQVLKADTLKSQLNNIGDLASQTILAGGSFVNRLEGNTLINGDTYINGSLIYSSNNSATTSVTSGGSIINGATQETFGTSVIANKGSSSASVDANGAMSVGIVDQTSGAMVVTNGVGNTHGFVVNETQATMSGGVNSTSMTLNDNGARFSNSATGRPVTVTGVADGSADFDATNYSQLRNVKRALAATSAMINIPGIDTNKRFSAGFGVGSYDDEEALAFGASMRVYKDAVIRASYGSSFSDGSNNDETWGVGAGWSW